MLTPPAPTTYRSSVPHRPGVRAWKGDALSARDWVLPVPDAVHRELDGLVDTLRRTSADPLDAARDYTTGQDLTQARALMQQVRDYLDHGSGFAVLDRFPVERYAKPELKSIYCLLSGLIGPIVPQSPDGTLLHDVVDTGKKMSERVRGDLTNQELNWHTDNGFADPPKYFGLAVLRTAREGGDSKAVNLLQAHDMIAKESLTLLRRLYQPFHWRRIGDYGDGDDSTAQFPVFGERESEFVCRLNRRVIQAGYEAAGEPFDSLGRDAIDALYATLDQPGVAMSYRLQPGQMQWMNNHALAHHRTTFVDWPDEDRRRHLVRIYMTDRDGAHVI
jgi:hypothetical protein